MDVKALARRGWKNLGALAVDGGDYACAVSAKDASSVEIFRGYYIKAHASVGLFQLACLPPGEEKEIFPGEGEPIVLPTSGPNDYSYSAIWQSGFWAAVVVREPDLNDFLATVPTEVCREAPIGEAEYSYLEMDLMKSFWLRKADVKEKLFAVMKATDPEIVAEKGFDVQLTLELCVPQYELIYRLLDEDEKGFNDAMVKALESHKSFWQRRDTHNELQGLLSTGLLGIASLAHMRGMRLEVESDYIPKALIEGRYAG
ncbi:MAG: immunity 49 family protein [Proteobacteria bacterium]|nr:immunity 49 family protein [Pseudomonadota bacterium]